MGRKQLASAGSEIADLSPICNRHEIPKQIPDKTHLT